MATEAQIKASVNYNRNRDNIMLRPTKEEGAAIRAAAAEAGQSVQAYVLKAVRTRMGQSGNPVQPGKVVQQSKDLLALLDTAPKSEGGAPPKSEPKKSKKIPLAPLDPNWKPSRES